MAAPQLDEAWRAAEIARQRAHVRAVVDAVVDARVLGREQVVVGRVGGRGHPVADQGRPPQSLLFGDGRDGPNAGADEADKCNIRARGVDDVADVGLRGSRIAGIEPVEDLLVAGAGFVQSSLQLRKFKRETHIYPVQYTTQSGRTTLSFILRQSFLSGLG